MKKVKTILLIVALSFSSIISASTNPEEGKSESAVITTAIEKLLKNPSFLIEKEIVARVRLTLNKDNEMVVLNVESDNEFIGRFIKYRLNYNKLPLSIKSSGKTFIVPVRIKVE